MGHFALPPPTMSPCTWHDFQILLQNLAINEMIEFVAPLVYLVCFVLAYYGPNSNMIGGVRSNYWQYSSHDDIGHAVSYILIFFVVDITSAFICHYLLWKLGKISLFRACLALQKELGFLFALRLINDVTAVRNRKTVI